MAEAGGAGGAGGATPPPSFLADQRTSPAHTGIFCKFWFGNSKMGIWYQFSIHHTLNLKFRSLFCKIHYWKLVDYHFCNPIFALNLLITNFNFRTKIYKKKPVLRAALLLQIFRPSAIPDQYYENGRARIKKIVKTLMDIHNGWRQWLNPVSIVICVAFIVLTSSVSK